MTDFTSFCIFNICCILLLQGALDGGLDIPHSEKRFAGFKKDDKQLDADIHRKYIYGGHVADYMKVSCACCLSYHSLFPYHISYH
jgi:hypothetical protein